MTDLDCLRIPAPAVSSEGAAVSWTSIFWCQRQVLWNLSGLFWLLLWLVSAFLVITQKRKEKEEEERGKEEGVEEEKESLLQEKLRGRKDKWE